MSRPASRHWPPLSLRERGGEWGLLLVLFAAGIASRAPISGSYLINWDAVQYALGLRHFDVTLHQPHPPGSILYVALGRVVLGLAGEANAALATISIVASAAAIVLCYAAGRQLFGARIAGVATVLYATSPLAWYYGAVALPYTLVGAIALGIAGLCWYAAEQRNARAVFGGAALLALAGGVRQTTMLLLLPLWLFAAWQAGRPKSAQQVRLVAAGLALLASLCLMWFLPLLALSGGPVAYVKAARQLSSLVNSISSVTALGPPAIAANLTYLGSVAAESLNVALATFAVFLLPGVRWPWRPTAPQRWFLILWAGPALLVFALFHTGQAGYLLLIWPLACYAAATALMLAADQVVAQWRRFGSLSPSARRGAAAGLCGAVNAAVFLLAPLAPDAAPHGLTASAIREVDRFWRGVASAVAETGPERTVVLTGSNASESFRHAAYYLPETTVHAIGFDRSGGFGVAFSGQHGAHTYAEFMAGQAALTALALPPATQTVLILDEPVARLFPVPALEPVTLDGARGRSTIWRVRASPEGAFASLALPRFATLEPGLLAGSSDVS